MRSVANQVFRRGILAVVLLVVGCSKDQGTGLLALSISTDSTVPQGAASSVVLTLPDGSSRTYNKGSFPPAGGSSLVLEFPNLPASDSPVTLTVQAFDSNHCLIASATIQVTVVAGAKTSRDITLTKAANACGDGGIPGVSPDGGDAAVDGTGDGIDSASAGGSEAGVAPVDGSARDTSAIDGFNDATQPNSAEVGGGPDAADASADAADAADVPLASETGPDVPLGSGGSAGAGGVTGTGGVAGTGGLNGTGGATSKGGASGSGGVTGNGGTPSTGGATGTGGVTVTGGSPSTGGVVGTGGSANGGSGSGGTVGTGGAGGTTTGGTAVGSTGCGKTSTLTFGTVPNETGSGFGNGGYVTIQSSGQTRGFAMRLPDNYDNTKPYWLIFAFHSNGGSAATVDSGGTDGYDFSYYGLQKQSKNGAIFVAPQATSNGWLNSGGQELTFVDDMVNLIEGNLCVDTTHLMSTGFSSGGSMTYEIACGRAKIFHAAAIFEGIQLSGCDGGTDPIAYWQMVGLTDTTTPINVARPMRNNFVKNNGCTPMDTALDAPGTALEPPMPPPYLNSGGHICTNYPGCSAGHPLRWCVHQSGSTPEPVDGSSTVYGPASASWVPADVWTWLTSF